MNLVNTESFLWHIQLSSIFIFADFISNKYIFNYYTSLKQVLWESAGAFFSARQLSRFSAQVA